MACTLLAAVSAAEMKLLASFMGSEGLSIVAAFRRTSALTSFCPFGQLADAVPAS